MLCRETFIEDSEEHLVLSALGGTLSRSRMTCGTCNHRTGNEIDAPFLAGFEWVTTIINPKNRRRPAQRLKKLRTAEGDILSIEPGGAIRMEARQLDDSRWIGNADQAKRITAWAEAAAQALSERTGEPVTVTTEFGQTFNPTFNFTLALDAHIIFRSATKTALEALSVAVAKGRFVPDSSLDPLRDYVLNGASSFSPDIGYLIEPVYPELLEKLEHSVLLLQREDGSVYFEVSTYGGLTSVAGILPKITQRLSPWLYRVDPVSGNRSISHPRKLPAVGQNWMLPPAMGDSNRFQGAIGRVARLWQERGDRSQTDRIFDESWLEVMTEPGKPITEAHVQALSKKIAGRLVDYLRNTKRLG